MPTKFQQYENELSSLDVACNQKKDCISIAKQSCMVGRNKYLWIDVVNFIRSFFRQIELQLLELYNTCWRDDNFVAIGMKLKSCISGVSKKKLRDSTVTFCATLVTWLCPKRESVQHSSSHILSRIMDNGRSRSLLHGRKSSKSRGYSTFDPGGSIDRGILASEDPERSSKRSNPRATTIEEERESLSISWENIDVFVEQPGPSFLKRLCFGTGDNERPTTKQILFNGEWFF